LHNKSIFKQYNNYFITKTTQAFLTTAPLPVSIQKKPASQSLRLIKIRSSFVTHKKLMYEGLFNTGDLIRAYDYDPSIEGSFASHLDGVVTGEVDTPFQAYVVQCTDCALGRRKGNQVLVPMELNTCEFENRISRLPII
jgi:hypothetical protein